MLTTGGRGFEVAYASYIWGAVILLSVAAWFWFQRDLRKHGGKKADRDEDKDSSEE